MSEFIKEINFDSGLKVLINSHGDDKSPVIQPNRIVYTDYIGYLEDGTIFSSSEKNGEVFQFKHGVGDVIPAWDEAFNGMKAGAHFTLVTPPELAYGEVGSRNGEIPPNSILIFEINIRGVQGL